MLDAYRAFSAGTGPSFVAAWTNADVTLAAFALFVVLFTVAAFRTSNPIAEASFLVLVAGGLAVAWPAMIVLTMASVLAAVVISFAHQALAPKRSAEVQAEADAMAGAALRKFADEPGLRGDVARLLRQGAAGRRRADDADR